MKAGIKTIKELVKWGVNWVWPIMAIVVILIRFYPQFVQWAYSKHVFEWLSMSLRWVSGKVGFALGEYIYILLIIVLIYNVIRWLFRFKNKIKNFQLTQLFFYRIIKKGSILFIIFEFMWGLNYHQSSPAESFGVSVPTHFSEMQMDSLSLALIDQMNQSRAIISDFRLKHLKVDSLVTQSLLHYSSISKKYAFLKYRQPSIKWAQFPRLGDYIGYLAFYQPISGEAIVRADLPLLTLPFTICHEMAHQLGYASETEANFIAYVVALHSKDPVFEYAMQLQLFTYSQEAQLRMIAKTGDFKKWENVVKRNKALLSPKVLNDRQNIRNFFTSRQSQRIPGSEKLYDQFLIWNKQSKGLDSYNDVLVWAIAYPKMRP